MGCLLLYINKHDKHNDILFRALRIGNGGVVVVMVFMEVCTCVRACVQVRDGDNYHHSLNAEVTPM